MDISLTIISYFIFISIAPLKLLLFDRGRRRRHNRYNISIKLTIILTDIGESAELFWLLNLLLLLLIKVSTA